MIISVISPVHGQGGNSTIAILLGILLSRTKTVCLTHLSPASDSFYTYFGLSELEDPTCTPSQIASLLRAEAISPSELKDYCKRVNNNLDIFSNNSTNFTAADMDITVKYITKHMPHEFIILDVDISLDNNLAKHALEVSDLTIVTMTQSKNVIKRYKQVTKGIDKLNKKKLLFVCNHFSPQIGSLSSFARQVLVSQSQCCPLHHSDIITKLENKGEVEDISKELAAKYELEVCKDLEGIEKKVLARCLQLKDKGGGSAWKM